jgi:hypothetical protein
MPSNIHDIPERLEFIAESIDENSYMHPLMANEDCLLAAKMAKEYLRLINTELSLVIEMQKLTEGSAWTQDKEDVLREEWLAVIENKFKEEKQ